MVPHAPVYGLIPLNVREGEKETGELTAAVFFFALPAVRKSLLSIANCLVNMKRVDLAVPKRFKWVSDYFMDAVKSSIAALVPHKNNARFNTGII